MLRMFKKLVVAAIRRRGYTLIRKDQEATIHSTLRKLAAGSSRHLETIIDVGASDGRWSRDAMREFPKPSYLLVEAQSTHRAGLDSFVRDHPNARYELVAAGDSDGHIEFDANDAFGGAASRTPAEGNNIRVPMRKIDSLVAENKLQPPFLIKLDTHGFEVPILVGAAETLKKANVLIIECYNFRIAPESLTFDEMCQYLRKLGFRPAYLLDLLFRPLDGVLWQMDIAFLRDDAAEFRTGNFA